MKHLPRQAVYGYCRTLNSANSQWILASNTEPSQHLRFITGLIWNRSLTSKSQHVNKCKTVHPTPCSFCTFLKFTQCMKWVTLVGNQGSSSSFPPLKWSQESATWVLPVRFPVPFWFSKSTALWLCSSPYTKHCIHITSLNPCMNTMSWGMLVPQPQVSILSGEQGETFVQEQRTRETECWDFSLQLNVLN